MAWFDILGWRRQRVRPRTTQGAPGYAVYAGYINSGEQNAKLADHERRHQLYRSILVNTSIVGAACRYYLNLVGKAEWSFQPAEGDGEGMYAERLEEMLTKDPETPWSRIVRAGAMYRYHGFSVQEWTARKREDGVITLADVERRMQHTIERWDVDEDGTIHGIIQQRPQDSQYLYLPRAKCLYLVDDSLSDSPEGIGLLRHLVGPYDRLTRYEQLEGIGFDTDLRGIPKVYAPLDELRRKADEGDDQDGDSNATVDSRLRGLTDFLKKHVRGLQSAVMLDSDIYRSEGDSQNASTTRKWDFDLVTGGQTAMPELAMAIDRLNREMARLMGVEQLMLGETSAGSFALSKDKTNQFYLTVDAAVSAIRDQVVRDIVKPLWMMNGWPDDMMPEIAVEAIRARDVEEISAALRDLAQAGATLELDDPIIDEVREIMGMAVRPDGGEAAAELQRTLATQMAADPPMDGGGPDG